VILESDSLRDKVAEDKTAMKEHPPSYLIIFKTGIIQK